MARYWRRPTSRVPCGVIAMRALLPLPDAGSVHVQEPPPGTSHPASSVVCVLVLAALGCQRPATPKAPAPQTPPSVPAAPSGGPSLPNMSDVAGDLTDKGPSGHLFTDIYERFLGGWRHDPIRIFEIGVASGGSLRLWNAYYDKASIFAIDIEDSKQYENARTKTLVADQSDRVALAKAMAAFGGEFDFILDDGGHRMEQQQISFGFLFKYVRAGGYYIIEDMHTSLTNKYVGGGYGAEPDGENTTLRMLERYIHREPPKLDSKYLLPSEVAYNQEHVDSVVISYRPDGDRSMVALIRKR